MWGYRSVHRSVEMASRRRFGAFVYTVATREDRASDRGDAGVYTDRPKWPLRAVLGHLCTLLRRESRYESRRELRQVARAPQPPRRAGGAPSLAPLAWSGRQALSEWRRCQVGIFAKASTHTNPRRATLTFNVVFDYRIRPSLRHGLTRPKMCCPFVERGHRSHAYQRHTPPHQ